MFQDLAQQSQSASPAAGTGLIVGLNALMIAAAGAATTIINRRHGRTKEAGKKSELTQLKESIEQKIDENHRETRETFMEIRLELQTLRGHVVGPDGENGIRGDVRELKTQVNALIERERQNLQRTAFGALDRRSGT